MSVTESTLDAERDARLARMYGDVGTETRRLHDEQCLTSARIAELEAQINDNGAALANVSYDSPLELVVELQNKQRALGHLLSILLARVEGLQRQDSALREDRRLRVELSGEAQREKRAERERVETRLRQITHLLAGASLLTPLELARVSSGPPGAAAARTEALNVAARERLTVERDELRRKLAALDEGVA